MKRAVVLLTHTLVPLVVLQVPLWAAAPVSTHQVLTTVLTPVVTITFVRICPEHTYTTKLLSEPVSIMNTDIGVLVSIVFRPSQVCAVESNEKPRWQSQLKLPGVFWQTPLEPHRLGSDAHSLLSTQRGGKVQTRVTQGTWYERLIITLFWMCWVILKFVETRRIGQITVEESNLSLSDVISDHER